MKRLERSMRRAIPLAPMPIAAAMAAAGCATRLGDQGPAGAPAAREAAPARPAPTRTGYADVPGARIYYQVHGDLTARKTPLLILHGSFMSADAMAPLIRSFAATRTVIATEARGHGRNGDVPGPLTYELLADDAAGVLKALNVAKAARLLDGREHGAADGDPPPGPLGKLIVLSGTYRRDGWYPEVLEAFESVTPQTFAGTPLEAEYRRLSPTPNAFPALVGKNKALDALPQAWPEEAIRAIAGKTVIVIGDADGVELEHAVKLFKLRGGGDVEAAAKGFIDKPPRARLAILPATSHIGILAQANLIADLAAPFLDDVTPPIAPGFLPEGAAAQASQGTTSQPTQREARP